MKEERKVFVQVYGVLIDLAIFTLSMILTVTFFDNIIIKLTDELKADITAYYVLMFVSALLAIISAEDYQNMFTRTKIEEFLDCIRLNFIIFAISAILLIISKNSMINSRYTFAGLIILNLILGYVGRLIFREVIKNYLSEQKGASLVGILTTGDKAEELISEVSDDWTKNVRGIAIVGKSARGKDNGDTILDVPVVSDEIDGFLEWARKDALDEVLIDIGDIDYRTNEQLRTLVDEVIKMGAEVHFNNPLLDEFSDYFCSVTYIESKPMLTIENTHQDFNKKLIKRLMDIAGGLVGTIISIPIIAVVAVPLLIESGRPLFFKQKRVGLNGRYFYMYKLRSMYNDAEEHKKELMDQNEVKGFMFKISDDPRITKVGKFIRKTSIDELPQFFNVLKGDMSLVGTRPPTVDEFKQYENYHKRRLSMKPGITGMWQANGRNDIDNFEDVVKMDLMYIDRWSIGLDIKILLKTIVVVFRGKGVK